jgi:hypothetical protein
MAAPRCFGVMLERVGHAHELVVVPRPSHELDIDGLSMIVVSQVPLASMT